ncbi:MAG: acyltransferase [Pseudomonadota bacterium]
MSRHHGAACLEEQSSAPCSSLELSHTAFINLNAIRALSGMVVVFSHFFQLYIMPVEGRTYFVNFAISMAEYAVIAFFALSGLLISLSIERNIRRHGCFMWREYLISRVARIYPALIASVLLCLILYGVLLLLGLDGAGALTRPSDVYPASRTEFSVSKAEVLLTLMQTYAFGPGGYIAVNGPLWTLSYEVGFYLVAGLLMTMARGAGIARLFAAVCLLLVVVVAIKMEKHLFLHYGSIWMLGVGLFFLLKRRADHVDDATVTSACGYFSVLCWRTASSTWVGILIFVLLCLSNALLILAKGEAALIHDYMAALVIIAAMYVLACTRRTMAGHLAKMAGSTYTLYLFHFPLMLFFYALIRDLYDISPVQYFILASVLTLTILLTSHYSARLLENRRLWESFYARLRGGYREAIS